VRSTAELCEKTIVDYDTGEDDAASLTAAA
jgi:hypothetical protein